MFEQIGFATLNGGTTGGEGGPIVDVYTDAQLSDALTANTNPAIVRLHGQIDVDGVINVKSNKTITSPGDGHIRYGELNISQSSNVIVTNIRMSESFRDCINIEYSENVWIHRNTLENSGDGLCDIKHGSNYITVSWNHFRNHVRTMLIGHDDANGAVDIGKLKTTIHNNWFENCEERIPRVRFGEVHSLNNYISDTLNGVRPGVDAQIYQENCYYDRALRPYTYDNPPSGWIKDVGSKFVDTITTEESRKTDRPEGVLWVPSSYYAYTAQTPDDAKASVMAYAGQQAPYSGPWHVSNSGNDVNNGSEQFPFATFEKALSVVQQGDTIKFECNGTYLPLIVNNLDGISSNKYYVTNYGSGANPVISGFVNPTWTSQGSNIWSFQDSGFTNVNILKLGNTNQPKGRLPEVGYNTITGRTGNTQITDTVNIASLPDVVGGELVSKKNKWILDTQTITAKSGNTITTNTASSYWYTVGYGYFVQNHANCLTQNGDWYYDSATKTVYLYHTTNPNSIDIKIGKYENCLYHNNSDYWEFFGIDFEGSVKEAAILRSSHNIKFTRCSFNYHGFNGIQTWLSRYLTIDYCHFNDIQNIGVNNRDTGGENPSSDALIQNSYFNNISMIPGASGNGNNQACAIKINNTEHNVVIRNNRLHNLGYIGIRFEGNNCLVEKNYAENGCLVKSDGALYYTFGSYTGIQVRDNIGINCVGNVEGTNHSGFWGVGDSCIYYADDNSSYVTFERNYARGGQYGFYLHNAQYIVASNNIAIGNHIQLRITDDGYNDGTLGDPVIDADLQFNTWIANSGQFLYEIRSTGTNLAFGIINNNKMRSVDANAFRIRMESDGETDLTLYDLTGWRSNLNYDINSTISDHDEEKELIIVNDSGGTDVYELDGDYLDLSGTEYVDNIELGENESIYLYKAEDVPPIEEYTITIIQSEGGIVTGGGVYDEGELATLEAVSDQDYEFIGWQEDSQIVETENPWIFVVVEDRSITPVFSEIIPPVEEYTVKVIQTPGGSVSGGGTYTEEDEATLTATPNTGWHFVRWSNNVTDNPYTFTVTEDVTLQAIFAQNDPITGVIVVKGKFRIV